MPPSRGYRRHTIPGAIVDRDRELRPLGGESDELHIVWIESETEAQDEGTAAPRDIIGRSSSTPSHGTSFSAGCAGDLRRFAPAVIRLSRVQADWGAAGPSERSRVGKSPSRYVCWAMRGEGCGAVVPAVLRALVADCLDHDGRERERCDTYAPKWRRLFAAQRFRGSRQTIEDKP
jgi:hypothetical protein